jgi:hypothetical protein
MGEFTPEEYRLGKKGTKGGSDAPSTREYRLEEAPSRELNPEDRMIIKDLLEKIAELQPRRIDEDEKKYDEMRGDLEEKMGELSIRAEDLEDLFPEYFVAEDGRKFEEDLSEFEEEMKWKEEFENKHALGEFQQQSALEAGVKGATSEVASGRSVDTLDEVLRKVKIATSSPKHQKKLRMQKKAA